MKIILRLCDEWSIIIHFHSVSQHEGCSGQSSSCVTAGWGYNCAECDPITLLSRKEDPFHSVAHFLYILDISCFVSPHLQLSFLFS